MSDGGAPAAGDLADWYESWARDAALPLWAGAGRDADGAFYERFGPDGAPDADAIRRVRVQFRQIYVYSAAHLLGLAPDGGEIALEAFKLVRARAWAPDGRPGWAHLLAPDGSVADATRDAYDQAFALFGAAWLHRATGDPVAAEAAAETLAFVDGDLAARSGGWWEALRPEDTPGGGAGAGAPALRRQNPHMHALEAMLALYEAFGDRGYLDRAREIFHLFAGRFYDWPRQVVIEYFDLDWRPAPRTQQRIEPGHMAEWVYLIREYERLTGESVDAIAGPLYRTARKLGRDPSGLYLIDELDLDGRPTKATRRLWPQTEHVKAALTQYRATGETAYRDDAVRALAALREGYLLDAPHGGWSDQFDLDGRSLVQTMPASSFYHVFGALAMARDLLRRPAPRRRSFETGRAEAMTIAAAAGPGARTITPVILAGGTGSRLWPLSTPASPKQFLPLAGALTLFQETLQRVTEPAMFGPAMVVAHQRHAETIAAQAAARKAAGAALDCLILEPEPRNSGPALAAAAYAAPPEALLLALPADHLIRETALFHGLVENAAAAAEQGAIVTFGVTPTRPETGFGYIRAGAPLGVAGAFEVDAFVEKPDLETARSYVASGAYLWNSGMFLFRAGDLRAELETHAPEMARAAADAVEAAADLSVDGDGAVVAARLLDAKAFAAAPSTSIDFALMEKTDRAAVCPAALTWSDIGSWDALADAQGGDPDGNYADGPVAMLDCAKVYARSDGLKIAAIGLDSVVIVAAGDQILITDRARAQKVKDVVALLGARDGDEAS